MWQVGSLPSMGMQNSAGLPLTPRFRPGDLGLRVEPLGDLRPGLGDVLRDVCCQCVGGCSSSPLLGLCKWEWQGDTNQTQQQSHST